ncbi:phosphotransferase enzyme family protein [Rossellomorea vietnamensis]|uniref:phosphotransferase enzyme family protein n=1 Tax=Rossellomorea vietnamensis TaxID=218284 RepID=UPI00077C91E2|nr:phosphotransferase [Rossellomorea vietnamensis]
MTTIVEKVIRSFFPEYKFLSIEKELHQGSWNNDLHYKINVDQHFYSIRFISHNRSGHQAFGKISDDVLMEQIRYTNFLAQQGIPFMKHVPSYEGQPFVSIEWNECYRVVLFKWIEGRHITKCTERFTGLVGDSVNKIHTVSKRFESGILPKISHLDGYVQFLDTVKEKLDTAELSDVIKELVYSYVINAEAHIFAGKTDTLEFIVQSDFNPLNLLWDDQGSLRGIVDVESIAYTDRMEGLAWLLKWYSRSDGIESKHFSPILAKTFLAAYRSVQAFSSEEIHRLQSLLWLSGCLNWNFVKRILDLIDIGDEEAMKQHLDHYEERAEKLVLLVKE